MTVRSAKLVEEILFRLADTLMDETSYRACQKTAAKLRRAMGVARSGDVGWLPDESRDHVQSL